MMITEEKYALHAMTDISPEALEAVNDEAHTKLIGNSINQHGVYALLIGMIAHVPWRL